MAYKKINLSGVNTAVIVRAIVTVIAALNIILGYLGVHLITLSEGEVSEIVNALIILATAAVWIWGFWKNNSFTNGAQIGDVILNEIKKLEETEAVQITVSPNEEADENGEKH